MSKQPPKEVEMQINTARDAFDIAVEYLWSIREDQYSERLKIALANIREAAVGVKYLDQEDVDFSLISDVTAKKITSNLEVISDECTKINNEIHQTAS